MVAFLQFLCAEYAMENCGIHMQSSLSNAQVSFQDSINIALNTCPDRCTENMLREPWQYADRFVFRSMRNEEADIWSTQVCTNRLCDGQYLKFVKAEANRREQFGMSARAVLPVATAMGED